MNLSFRDGKFDVVVAAGPRIDVWPSVGVRSLSTLCAEMGLTVGLFGGESVTVRGVIPLPVTGGLVLIQDVQNRIHRIRARAIIRVSPESSVPDSFRGWRSQGLIPLSSAEKLLRESPDLWHPVTAVLGTGNRALRFASTLLESGVPEVFCIESQPQWRAKRFAGWEVERRRFEMLGGKLIEAKPIQLLPKSPLLWQLRLQDQVGIRVLDVGRVVSAGPFRDLPGVREYPPGSFLFELDQTAALTHEEDVEGWVLEKERGKWLGGKIIKSLVTELGPKREIVDRVFRRARGRLKRYLRHREIPFTPSYQGKWVGVSDAKRIRSHGGVPQEAHLNRPIASVECFEEIPCDLCQTVCPTSAIQIGPTARSKNRILNEAACTACGLCVVHCPSSSIPLIQENESLATSSLTLPWGGSKPWEVGDLATLINRRGESLGSGRVVKISELPNVKTQLVQVEIPTYLIWDARGLRRGRPSSAAVEPPFPALSHPDSAESGKVEITLNGEKRLVRDRIPITVALFEMGQGRSDDVLSCKDGSCGLCGVVVDSVKKPACQTRIHRGMAIRTQQIPLDSTDEDLCPCVGVTQSQVIERLHQGKLQSPEAVLSVTRVGEGKCHGQLCMGAFRRILMDQGLDVSQWIDWRFPWSDWTVNHN